MDHRLRMRQLQQRRNTQVAMQTDALQRGNRVLLKEHTFNIKKIDKVIRMEVQTHPVENFLLNFEFSSDNIYQLEDFLQEYDLMPEHNYRQALNYKHLSGLYNTYLEMQQ